MYTFLFKPVGYSLLNVLAPNMDYSSDCLSRLTCSRNVLCTLLAILVSALPQQGFADEASQCKAQLENKESFFPKDVGTYQNTIFVLDTNVLINEPDLVYKLPKAKIHIPLVDLEELDGFKHEQSDRGHGYRAFSRVLDHLRGMGSLQHGVELENGAKIYIDPTPEGVNTTADKTILKIAKEHQENSDRDVVLLTEDTNLRIRADFEGVKAITVGHLLGYDGKLPSSYRSITVNSFTWDQLQKGVNHVEVPLGKPNEYLLISKAGDQGEDPLLRRYDASTQSLVPLMDYKSLPLPISPLSRNLEQQIALDLLLNENIPLVTVTGVPGSGKTFLAVAAALYSVMFSRNSTIKKVYITRAIQPTGKDPGALPGGVAQKHEEYLKGIRQNIKKVLQIAEERGFNNSLREEVKADGEELGNIKTRRRKRKNRSRNNSVAPQAATTHPSETGKKLSAAGFVEILPLAYVRGQTIDDAILILDEAQNLPPKEIHALLTRMGNNSRAFLVGDTDQIDVNYLSSTSSGLYRVVEVFAESALAGHVYLTKGVRSPLASEAHQRLKP
jgi:PhoH-like ATPase